MGLGSVSRHPHHHCHHLPAKWPDQSWGPSGDVLYQGEGKKLSCLLLMAKAYATFGLGRWWVSAQPSKPPFSREGWEQRGQGQRKGKEAEVQTKWEHPSPLSRSQVSLSCLNTKLRLCWVACRLAGRQASVP